MNKALDRLEHLRLGIQHINQDESPAFISQYEEDINIIEAALKKLEKPKEIVGTTTVDKALEQFLIDNCPEVREKLKDAENYKKASETFKKLLSKSGIEVRFDGHKEITIIWYQKDGKYEDECYYLYKCESREEYELLKEIFSNE